VADNSITTAKIANGAVTDAKITSVAGSKITGVIPVASGGTGQTSITGIQSTLGLLSNNIAIGSQAGTPNQGVNANTVAIGGGAGNSGQGQSAIGIGYVAGYANQGANGIAIGSNTAQSNQSSQAVALGYAAGQYGQGQNSVAIGAFAGNNAQVANSIALNATGASLNPTNAGLYVDPIRSATAATNLLYYNTTTKEVTSAAGSFVDLTTNQTIAGSKTFSSNINVNGVSVGRGNGNNDESVAIGPGAMGSSNVNGKRNTAIGAGTMSQYNGTSWDNNTAVGYRNMPSLTSGSGNTSVGAESMLNLLTGTSNTSIGNQSLINVTGSSNVGVGKRSGQTITTGSQNTIVGTDADVSSATLNNATAVGYGAQVTASNSIQLGNSSVTNVKTSGTITAGAVTYPNTSGSNGQVLTTNGSGVASWANTSGTTNSIWVNNLSFEMPSTPTNGVESFYGIFNGYYYKFLSLYNDFSSISQTRSYITPPTSWGNGSYTVTVYYLTSSAASGNIKLSAGVIPVTMSGLVTTSNEFQGNSVGGFQHGSASYDFTLTAAANTGDQSWSRPLQKASFTQNFNFSNIDYAVVQLGRYMPQGYSYSDTYPDKVYILGVKITKN
jgi:hypothetical protein